MKKLTIIFALSLSVIIAIASYNTYKSNDDNKSIVFTKTIINTNNNNQILSKTTLTLNGTKWIETSKIEYEYKEDSTTEILYGFSNGNWLREKKIINEYNNSSLISKTIYTFNNSKHIWIEHSKENYTDLSVDDDTFHDLVFDMYGNLIMDATYQWQDQIGEGLTKEEYTYLPNGMPNQKTSYIWQGNQWVKSEVSDLLYQSNINNQN